MLNTIAFLIAFYISYSIIEPEGFLGFLGTVLLAIPIVIPIIWIIALIVVFIDSKLES